MGRIGVVAAITRYPVKSMRGEPLERAGLTPHGLAGDRLYAFESTGAPSGMLRLTGRERRAMLDYQAVISPEGLVKVLTPAEGRHPVDSPDLLALLQAGADPGSRLSLTRAATPQTDVRPVSLLSLETIEALASELGSVLDPRRFRANLLLSLAGGPFAEDALAGRTIRIGRDVTLSIRERTPRCRFVTYDPASPLGLEPLFSLMKLLDLRHAGRAGVYASVTTSGCIVCGHEVTLLD